MKLKYYKPKFLLCGLVLFAISNIGLGYLFGMEASDDTSIINVSLIISVIGIFIGEGLILEASSYKVKSSPKKERKK